MRFLHPSPRRPQFCLLSSSLRLCALLLTFSTVKKFSRQGALDNNHSSDATINPTNASSPTQQLLLHSLFLSNIPTNTVTHQVLHCNQALQRTDTSQTNRPRKAPSQFSLQQLHTVGSDETRCSLSIIIIIVIIISETCVVYGRRRIFAQTHNPRHRPTGSSRLPPPTSSAKESVLLKRCDRLLTALRSTPQ